jgi:hypothetical protein
MQSEDREMGGIKQGIEDYHTISANFSQLSSTTKVLLGSGSCVSGVSSSGNGPSMTSDLFTALMDGKLGL